MAKGYFALSAVLVCACACSLLADTYTYDDAGRLIAASLSSGKVISYSYDKAGNLLSRVVSAAEVPHIAAIVSAASGTITTPAPASIATLYGASLAYATGASNTSTLPTNLDGTTVTIIDSSGAQQTSPLFYVSPGQVNYLVRAGTALGEARVVVTNSAGLQGSASVKINNVAPGIFQLNASGLAAVIVLIVAPDGSQTSQNVYQLTPSNKVIALPINLSAGQVYLELYGTGIRNAKNVTVTVGSQSVPVLSSGAQGSYLGLDQVNIGPLPKSLAGSGQTNIVLKADGQAANTVNVTFQ
jgi:uncharacterized protein (TIGR03437 family)